MCVVSLWLYFRQDNWLSLLGVDTMGSTVDRLAGGVTFDSQFTIIYISALLGQIKKNTPWQPRLYPCLLSLYNKQKGIIKINLIKGQWWLSGGRNDIQICVWVGFCSPFQSQMRSCLNLNIQRNEKKSVISPLSGFHVCIYLLLDSSIISCTTRCYKCILHTDNDQSCMSQ